MKSTRQRNPNLKVPGGTVGGRAGAESERERHGLGIRRKQGRSEGLVALVRHSHGEVQ